MTQSATRQPRTIAAFSAIAVGGMLVHNALELGPAFLVSPETTVPVGLYAVLTWLVRRPRTSAVSRLALLFWALLNLVVGGIVSVLPLGLFPFVPDQSLGHYGAHAVYAASQVPLVLVAIRLLHRDRGTLAAGERG
jgi:hypothetical protein